MNAKAHAPFRHQLLLSVLTLIVVSLGTAGSIAFQVWSGGKIVCQQEWISEEAAARDAAYKISGLLDRRIYRTRMLVDALSDGYSAGQIKERRELYNSMMFEWNENLNRNYGLVEMSFGLPTRNRFENEISPKLISISRKINKNPSSFADIKDAMNDVNEDIAQLNNGMFRAIQQRRVGSQISDSPPQNPLRFFGASCREPRS